MKPTDTIPGYKIYEYQLVLNPHEELRNRIMKVKQDFYEKYKAATALHARPYVLLSAFSQYGLVEERLVHRLNVIAMGCHPVKIEMKDFGSFPSHTLYINITSRAQVQELVRQIRSQAQRLMKLNDDN